MPIYLLLADLKVDIVADQACTTDWVEYDHRPCRESLVGMISGHPFLIRS